MNWLYSVTIQDLGDYPRPADRNAMIYRLVTILERRGEKVEGKLEIAINEQGEMYFTTTSKASHKRFLLNFYGISSEKLMMPAAVILRTLQQEKPLS